MKTTEQKAFELYMAINSQGDLLHWLHCAMQTQALLCLFSADDFKMLKDTIANQPYGFEDDYKNALLSLLDKGMSYDLP